MPHPLDISHRHGRLVLPIPLHKACTNIGRTVPFLCHRASRVGPDLMANLIPRFGRPALLDVKANQAHGVLHELGAALAQDTTIG